ncbi:hypothetical protein [Janthinobacterium agaricidamnosum]|uniref:Transmembrane protein n=1 Tax=Janthinobacterium agaricidamnosum NBRC 102515 = DSM 9628 TaxID=1349767 RepID=W0V6E4_9BURK|nr:hypothetical protein [Janthinobacterium agaricidamnosum]CDG83175.1 hypothetical protein GJA_2544 [Janthinobacterium agaricidamnosum NBRC 102515 = DSM 9628]
MRPWLSRSLLVAGAFIVCWGGAVWYWRSGKHVPDGTDLALYLLILPLALLLLFWGGKKLLAMAAAAPAASAAAPQAPRQAEQAAPAAALTIVSGALRMPHGATPQELAEALVSRQARLELDPELTDNDGYPVMTGRIADVDELEQQETMAPWLAAQGLDQLRFDPEQWRALALGSAVLDELARAVSAHAGLAAHAEAQAGGRATPGLPPLPTLLFLPLLPEHWPVAQRDAASQWWLHLITEHGWPAAQLALSLPPSGAQLAPYALINQVAQQHRQEQRPCLLLLLACASHIGENSVQDWAARELLFSSRNQSGQVPGEGAAGLLLADAQQGALFDSAPPVLLHGASVASRASSADAKGRIDHLLLTELGAKALARGGAAAAEVSLVAADSGQRASRMSELTGMTGELLPQLDFDTQVLNLGASCGQAGNVTPLAALVLGWQDARDNTGVVLCVSNQQPFQRSAMLVGQGAAPPPSS